MADLRKRESRKKPYQVRFLDTSRQSGYGYKSFTRWNDANAFRIQKDLEEQGTFKPNEINEVAQAVDRWLEICETEGTDGNDPVTPYTLENYVYYARFMKAYPWDKTLQQLTPPDIVNFRSWLTLNCPSRYVARKTLAYFKSVLSEMVLRGEITSNIASGITVKATSRYDTPVTIPTEEDVLALLAAADRLANAKNVKVANAWQRYRPMVYLALDSGMRPQEYIALGQQSVQEKGVMVERAISGDGREISVTKTVSGRRFIDLTPSTLGMLNHYIEHHALPNDFDLVFPSEMTGRWQDRRNWQKRGFNVACMEAGLVEEVEDKKTGRLVEKPKYIPYDLRHFFASMLIEYVPNIKKIQKMMGHKNIETTLNVYGHLIEKRQDEQRDYTSTEPGVIGWLQ